MRECRAMLLAAVVGLASSADVRAQQGGKSLIAHRGASAYAPEHTMAAYRLALEQGADFVEQDLQLTKDGVLVCLHDESLERTTNVEEVFPDRGRPAGAADRKSATWRVSDFTLDEIKRLDAGAWFDRKFAGERVPTWQEAIDLINGRAGLYPELKAPDAYRSVGLDMERRVIETLRQNGLDTPGASPRPSVIIQSFSAESLRRLTGLGVSLPLVLLVEERDGARWLSKEGLRDAMAFASGIGPAKRALVTDPSIVARAHALGLSVAAWTFRSRDVPPGETVRDEMSRYLYELGVDAVFTDNPDQFPRRPVP